MPPGMGTKGGAVSAGGTGAAGEPAAAANSAASARRRGRGFMRHFLGSGTVESSFPRSAWERTSVTRSVTSARCWGRRVRFRAGTRSVRAAFPRGAWERGLREQFLDHLAGHVGQAEVAALETVRQLQVVEAEQVQD